MTFFLGHGLEAGTWTFPPLSGFPYLLMISLGTLLAAEFTSQAKGRKGAGVLNPSPSDLLVHGGVVAPERVQQLVWSLVGGGRLLEGEVEAIGGEVGRHAPHGDADGLPPDGVPR